MWLKLCSSATGALEHGNLMDYFQISDYSSGLQWVWPPAGQDMLTVKLYPNQISDLIKWGQFVTDNWPRSTLQLVQCPPLTNEMYISYDKAIPAKIGLTKISRRTKILVYGKKGSWLKRLVLVFGRWTQYNPTIEDETQRVYQAPQ